MRYQCARLVALGFLMQLLHITAAIKLELQPKESQCVQYSTGTDYIQVSISSGTTCCRVVPCMHASRVSCNWNSGSAILCHEHPFSKLHALMSELLEWELMTAENLSNDVFSCFQIPSRQKRINLRSGRKWVAIAMFSIAVFQTWPFYIHTTLSLFGAQIQLVAQITA